MKNVVDSNLQKNKKSMKKANEKFICYIYSQKRDNPSNEERSTPSS